MADEIDELLRMSLVAATDSDRADIGARIARTPDVIAKINARLRSLEWETRRTAMHFTSRLAPPPVELAPAIVSTLYSPLSEDPFGEETVLGLVIAGAIAAQMTTHRRVIEKRLGWIQRAIELGDSEVSDHPGEPTQFDGFRDRANIVLRLARDTLAKIDAAIGAEHTKYEALIAMIAGRFETTPGEAIAMVALQATTNPERQAWAARVWRDIAHRFVDTSPNRRAALEHSLEALRWDASGATSGGEGLARMEAVYELEREIAALPTS